MRSMHVHIYACNVGCIDILKSMLHSRVKNVRLSPKTHVKPTADTKPQARFRSK